MSEEVERLVREAIAALEQAHVALQAALDIDRPADT